MDVRERLSRNIQRIRRLQGLSQEDLAHAAGIYSTYLSGVEGGKRNPSLLVMERIAIGLGVDIAELLRAD